MRRAIYPLLALLLAASLALVSSAPDSVGQPKESSLLSRFGLQLPEIFDFAKFKQIYQKHYGSPVEEAHRIKLFLGRAFQVFVTFAKYANGASSKYLALNHMSDLTPEERERRFMPLDPSDLDQDDEQDDRQETEIQAASLEDIERKFAEIEQHKDESPEYAQIAAALEGSSSSSGSGKMRRRRRSVDSEGPLSVEQLMRDPSRIVEPISPKLRESIESNNPDYKPPQVSHRELASKWADEQLSEEEARKIDQGSSGFLSNVAGFMRHPFSASKRHPSRAAPVDDRLLLDYRQEDCIAEVKDQGSCNSCYIFSILAVFEYLHCKQTGQLVPFAEQYVLDCGKQADLGLGGCGSSPPESTWLFVQKFGLELNANYPYSARVHTCPYSRSDDTSSMGHTHVREVNHVDLGQMNRKKDVIDRLLREKGPLVIGLKVDVQFSDYGGGVDRPKARWLTSRHAMTIVGEGVEAGQEYWLIRNSMGKDWGLSGYYKLSKDVDPKVLVKISYVQTKFNQNVHHNGDRLANKLEARS